MYTASFFRNSFRILILLTMVFLVSSSHAQQGKLFKKQYIKSAMVKVASWQFVHPNGKPENTWTNGAFYTGVVAAYETTRSQLLFDSVKAMGERNNWLPAKRYDHADDIAISQTYIDMYRMTNDRKMIQASIDSIAKIFTVPGDQIRRNGITWWWCDALFMAPPTLAKLSATLQDPSYLALNDKLFMQCYTRLYDKQEKLFARDASYLWDEQGNGKKESNGKKVFWARGNGWVVAGLARLISELPKDHETRNFYISLFKEMTDRLLTLQEKDGLWRTSLLDPGAFPGGEGSGSAFNCYAMAWGVNEGILDKDKYLPSIKNAWVGLNTLLSPEGRFGWVQPIGADPKRNFNADSWESYGSGAFLLAASQVIKLKK